MPSIWAAHFDGRRSNGGSSEGGLSFLGTVSYRPQNQSAHGADDQGDPHVEQGFGQSQGEASEPGMGHATGVAETDALPDSMQHAP